MDDGMRIGEVAELVGVSTRAIRHYHHAGVLAEPPRTSGGYRAYALSNVVELLRVRRLVELGLTLAEVSDALTAGASGEGEAELREILQDLRDELVRQEERIAARREAVEELLARPTDLTRSEGHHQMLSRLRETWPAGHPGVAREEQASDLLEAAVGADKAGDLWAAYDLTIADAELAARMAALSERFEALAGTDPLDPAVDRLADQAGDVGPAVGALIPAELTAGDSPAAPDQVLETLTADMDPAQARCLRLMFARWQEQSS